MVVLTILGCRPQFIKSKLVSDEFRRRGIKEIVVHTGQHHDRNMSAVFFDELKLAKPKYNLGVNGGTHCQQLGEMIKRIEKIVIKEQPDCMIVYGDTNSTLAGALVANKLRIRLAHVEAGLRSYDMDMPEEQNRVLTDAISDLLFCPTEMARKTISSMHFHSINFVVGDVMFDMLLSYKKKLKRVYGGPYYLATIHRAENTNTRKKMETILSALNELKHEVVLPVHPRIKGLIKKKLYGNIRFIKPQSYIKMLSLEKYAKKIITDSGGVQKEAFILGIPCITLRKSTEWKETVKKGGNMLCMIDRYEIIRKVHMEHRKFSCGNIYGDGKAYKKIVRIISELWN
jgi:UDP-GlcNAc3NAcA epimerase